MVQGGKPTREDRLKAALKANMGRRKAQKRNRAEDMSPDTVAKDAPDHKNGPADGPDEQETPNG